ncbi:MAG: contractile injection system tape measure protein, partial [Bacteroidota bacterium]
NFTNFKSELSFIDGMHFFEYALRDFINLSKISLEKSLEKTALDPGTSDENSVKNYDEEGTLIGQAGLVLLHPFLKHFFINMDLLSGKEIREDKKELAVHLLHYVATRNEQPMEHDLVFEKYLCNIPAQQPVDRFVKLSEDQKQSCNELLEAVLNHWSGLRTNAIDALRSEFLIRDGKLTLKEDAHKLFVPRKTQDILLDTLPWNLHLVKLPWKEQMLYVEW